MPTLVGSLEEKEVVAAGVGSAFAFVLGEKMVGGGESYLSEGTEGETVEKQDGKDEHNMMR